MTPGGMQNSYTKTMLLVNGIILLVLAVYGFFGYRRGVFLQTMELVQLIVSFALALVLSAPLAEAIAPNVRTPRGFVALSSFLVLWFAIEMLLSLVIRVVRKKLPSVEDHQGLRIAGIAPALLKGSSLLVIVFSIIAAAPVPSSAKDPILGAQLARPLVGAGQLWQREFDRVFGEALRDVLSVRTIKTGDEGNVSLGFTKTDGKVCADDEDKMVDLVNDERTRRGLRPVKTDEALREVGRAHSRDMLAKGYFSHVSPDGVDPFRRMARARITYEYAGENLAFGPNVTIAHKGLMDSPGHKANILKPEYAKLGVGCIDAGLRGKIFSQEFTG